MADSNRTRGNGFKLEEDRFRLDVRNKFFTVRLTGLGCPVRSVDAPSLETFNASLDGAVSNLV